MVQVPGAGMERAAVQEGFSALQESIVEDEQKSEEESRYLSLALSTVLKYKP